MALQDVNPSGHCEDSGPAVGITNRCKNGPTLGHDAEPIPGLGIIVSAAAPLGRPKTVVSGPIASNAG